MAKYDKLVAFIINNVGGKDNIESVTHCMTRLRFKLVDESKVNEKELIENKDILTAQTAGGKYQVVVGTKVGDIYEEMLIQLGQGNVQNKESNNDKKDSLLNRLTALITQIMLPALGVICAGGLISALKSILTVSSLIQATDGAAILLNAMANASLTFFPIILGYTSAKTFKMNPYIGMLLGAILVFPDLTSSMNSGDVLYTLFESSAFAMPVYKTFLGLPILFPANGYTSTVIPIIFSTFVTSKIEARLKGLLPQVTHSSLLGFFTVLIGSTLTFLLVGPTAVILDKAISVSLTFLFGKSYVITLAIIALIYQPLVIFGLHWPLLSIAVLNYMTLGYDFILATIFPAPFAHMGACLAVFLRTRSKKLKNISMSAFLSACFCIIEPSFYGVTLPVKKRFGYCMVAGFIGGLIIAVTSTVKYSVGSGITGFPTFIDPSTGSMKFMIIALVASLITFAIAFALTWITYRTGEDNYGDESNESPRRD